jgi:hypothetical protein
MKGYEKEHQISFRTQKYKIAVPQPREEKYPRANIREESCQDGLD